MFYQGVVTGLALLPLSLLCIFIVTRTWGLPGGGMNAKKILSMPVLIIGVGPLIEEAIFRLPLLIVLHSAPVIQIAAIVLSASIFALAHSQPVGTKDEKIKTPRYTRWAIHAPWAIALGFVFLDTAATHGAGYAYIVVTIAHATNNAVAYFLTFCIYLSEKATAKA